MASKSALLRNIRPSGGLFTENILLKLRDNPNQLKIGKIDSFLEEDTKEERKKLTDKKQIIFDWCIQKWDEISPNIEEWSVEDLSKKWLIPLFTLFDHEIEDFEINKENLDEDSILKEFRISYQSLDHRDPFFHYVSINEDFDSKIDRNPQKKSHHNVCQQFINFSPDLKWLFLSNGRILRILTKYYHSYSKGYLEFDLENIFANRDEREFDTLYSIIHLSRFIPEYEDHLFLIDLLQKESVSEGIKVGDALRDNIHDAIELLGDELIQQNPRLQDLVLTDEFDKEEYYTELLRIIYRIIFILYAEQREMLPGVSTLYFEQFSLSSFRVLAEKPIKAEKNYDLWKKLFLTFQLVNKGNELLGVNSFNGSFFKNKYLSLILEYDLKLSNAILLRVIRKLTTSKINNVLQRVNFLEVTEEEIGAIYESLLDYKPYIDSNSQFQLIEGTERKSTGSYYTPKELIDILIRTTLQPLVEDRLEKAGDEVWQKEKAILDIKVCDPACGGGTFLLSVLDSLGKYLAEVRTGTDSPLEDELREARRDVLQHSIYGVDMNPLAVELAKISLWLRASVKDKPLNFLDNHIKCGNSLIGLGQKMEINEINPKAFEAISGNKATEIPPENKKLKNKAREIIRKEINERRKNGRTTLITSFFTEKKTADICSAKFKEIIDMPESDPKKIKEKERKYYSVRDNVNYQQALNEANIWTSTFFWPFEGESLGEIPRYTTIEQLRDEIVDPELNNLMDNIKNIAEKNQFFHWYIEFPEVFSTERQGFDCLLTNPPWETIQLKENEFFIGTNNDIINASNQSVRRKLIKALKVDNPELFNRYKITWQSTKKISQFLTSSGLYDLSARGTINTYALFTERCWALISPNGYVGIIVPTGLISSYHLQDLFRNLVKNRAILSLFDFENRKKLFDIDSRIRFCLITLGGRNISQEIIPMTFYALEPERLQEVLTLILNNKNLRESSLKLADDHFLILLEESDFELFNPNTLTCPSFRFKKDAEILKKIYKRTSILIKKNYETGEIVRNPWNIRFNTTFHMANDSKLFKNSNYLIQNDFRLKKNNAYQKESIQFFPLYEAKLINQYDHHFGTFQDVSEKDLKNGKCRSLTEDELKNIDLAITPRYWVNESDLKKKISLNDAEIKDFLIVYRCIARAVDARTMISTIIPYTACGHSLQILIIRGKIDPKLLCAFMANLNSIVLDFVIRNKISGANISNFVIEQIPVFTPESYNTRVLGLIYKRVLKLLYNSNILKSFAKFMSYEKEPFEWKFEDRELIQAELDAIFALLYNISKNELKYILNSFFVLEKKEMGKYNEFRTKRLILEAYNRFSKQKELFV
ncbi:hypothetical protein LCGC14_1096230 [marine sediment metagenome]|uniref:site-specific DNA-methyltransferase (adenine-specific) n=1 Tax=marine sediment metagenome TaxID=412755 RepID=A0A0F9QGW1_9ZZZZ